MLSDKFTRNRRYHGRKAEQAMMLGVISVCFIRVPFELVLAAAGRAVVATSYLLGCFARSGGRRAARSPLPLRALATSARASTRQHQSKQPRTAAGRAWAAARSASQAMVGWLRAAA